jgi:hypothetical protein
MGDPPTSLANRLFWLPVLLACLCWPGWADLLSDASFETLAKDDAHWLASDETRAETIDGRLVVRASGGFVLVSQDLDEGELEPGRILDWGCDAQVMRLAVGRGAWISVQFSDAFDRRLGTKTSAILAIPGTPFRLATRTAVPEGTRRASVVLVTHGEAEAHFWDPVATLGAAPTPPDTPLPSPVPVTEGAPVAGPWLGIGQSVDLGSMVTGTVQSAAPRMLRILVPWSALPLADEPPEELVGRITTTITRMAPGERHVILVPTGGDAQRYADPLRVAAALRFLVEAVRDSVGEREGGEQVRYYLGPATRPDSKPFLDLPHYLACVEELTPLLPEGVGMAGPFEAAGGLWATLLRPALASAGGLLAADVALPRRDLALTGETFASLSDAGVEVCVIDVTSDHPDAAPYLGSSRHHLDAIGVLLEAPRRGIRVPVVGHGQALPGAIASVLGRAARLGPVATPIEVPAGAPLTGLVVRDPGADGIAVVLLNRGLDALSVELEIDFGADERRLNRVELAAASEFEPSTSEISVIQGRLSDVLPGDALVVYRSP